MGFSILKSIRSFGYFFLIFVLAFGVILIKPTQKARAITATPISNCAELQAINPDPDNLTGVDPLTVSYVQTASFSCSGIANFVPIGSSSTPFIGTYDGANFQITDLSVISDLPVIGLFGKLGTAGTVRNVKLVDANVNGIDTNENSAGVTTAGSLVGTNNGIITNSSSTGEVSSDSYKTGGLVGYNTSDGTITNSSSTANVTGTGDATGGLAGQNNGAISESYATGIVIGVSYVGGLVGFSWSTITNAYARGSVTGVGSVGGLVGGNNGSVVKVYATGSVSITGEIDNAGGLEASGGIGVITSSYFDKQTTGRNDNLGTPKTTAEMKTQSTYQPSGEENWNFSTPGGVWTIDTTGANNNGYPFFQWQDDTGPAFEVLGGGDTRTINIDAGQVITTNPYTIKVLPKDLTGISKVEFYIDNVLICTDTTADADGYYTCSWDTSKYHSDVKVIAYDGQGNSTILTRTTTVSLTGVPNTGFSQISYLPAVIILVAGAGLMLVSRRRILDEN